MFPVCTTTALSSTDETDRDPETLSYTWGLSGHIGRGGSYPPPAPTDVPQREWFGLNVEPIGARPSARCLPVRSVALKPRNPSPRWDQVVSVPRI
jgi:hypothetical protein